MSIRIVNIFNDFTKNNYNSITTENLKKGLKEHFNINLDEEILDNNKELEGKILWVARDIFLAGKPVLIEIGEKKTRIFE